MSMFPKAQNDAGENCLSPEALEWFDKVTKRDAAICNSPCEGPYRGAEPSGGVQNAHRFQGEREVVMPQTGTIAVGDVIRFIFTIVAAHSSHQFASTSWHYIVRKIVADDTFSVWCYSIADALVTRWKALDNLISNELSLDQIEFEKVGTEHDKGGVGVSAVGDDSSDVGSLRQSIVVAAYTATKGRSYQGRNYLWPADKTENSHGNLNGGTEQGYRVWANSMIAVTDDHQRAASLVVYSPTLSAKGSTVVVTPVTSMIVRGIVGSQRRRQKVNQ